MAVLDYISAARNETFAARTAMCLTIAAINVANEADTTPNHANRLAFAQRVLKNEINSKLVAAAAIAYNGTLQAEINAAPSQFGASVPDSDLQFVVNSLIDLFANAYAAAV